MISENGLSACSLGPRDCPKRMQTKQYVMNERELPESDRRLLTMQSGQTEGISTVCGHHYMVYVKRDTTLLAPKSCCNPFLEHDANRRGTSVITTTLTDLDPRLRLIPGNRLCQKCNRRCYKTLKTEDSGSLARETGASKSDTEAASQDAEEGHIASGESSVTRSRRQTDRS